MQSRAYEDKNKTVVNEGSLEAQAKTVLRVAPHRMTSRMVGRYTLFPRLRATADLLMMPKEVLTDRAIRAEVVPGLALRRICALLARFQPDDFAPDPLPPGKPR